MDLCLNNCKPHLLTPLSAVCVTRCTFKKMYGHWAMHQYREYKRLYFSGFIMKKGYSVDVFPPNSYCKMPQESYFPFTSLWDLAVVFVPDFEVYAMLVGYFQFVFHGRSMYTEEKSTNMLYIIHSSTLATEVWKHLHAPFRGQCAQWDITGYFRRHDFCKIDFSLIQSTFLWIVNMYPKMHPTHIYLTIPGTEK